VEAGCAVVTSGVRFSGGSHLGVGTAARGFSTGVEISVQIGAFAPMAVRMWACAVKLLMLLILLLVGWY
jgi:hypothetical protein